MEAASTHRKAGEHVLSCFYACAMHHSPKRPHWFYISRPWRQLSRKVHAALGQRLYETHFKWELRENHVGTPPQTHISTLLFPQFTLVQPKPFHFCSKWGGGGEGYDKIMCLRTHDYTLTQACRCACFHRRLSWQGGRRLWRGSITNCSVAFVYVWSKSSTVCSCALTNTKAAWKFHQISNFQFLVDLL